ncbi:MAG: NIPSNAP family protein [Pseudolabrys sp.]|nr:NIPSNAP family protein [Pseudolabrys sp.]
MIYEMRVYRAVPGRMPALLNRFENTTLTLWQTRGFRPVGFWTTLIGESNMDLTYLLAWNSLAERERIWNAFMADPEWIAKRTESEKDGPIVANITNTILQPTAFSAMK